MIKNVYLESARVVKTKTPLSDGSILIHVSYIKFIVGVSSTTEESIDFAIFKKNRTEFLAILMMPVVGITASIPIIIWRTPGNMTIVLQRSLHHWHSISSSSIGSQEEGQPNISKRFLALKEWETPESIQQTLWVIALPS